MKTPLLQVRDLNDQIFTAGLKLGDVLSEAGLDPSVWSKWAKGADAKRDSLDRVQAAVNVLRARKQEAAGV